MKQINIKKQDIITNSVILQSQEECDSWLAQEEANESFGKQEYDEEVLAPDGISVLETIHHEAEYSVEIVDVTTELQARKDSVDALAYLAATDYYIIREMDAGIQCPVEVKLARAIARTKVITE